MEYHQNDSNSCCLSSLSYSFIASGEENAVRAITVQIEELLHCFSKGYKDKISFDNDIMKYQSSNLVKQRLRYNIKKWIKQGSFRVLNDISETFTLVKLMDTVRNFNREGGIVGYCIFYRNNKISLLLTIYSMNLICSTSVIEELVAWLEMVFYAVR